MVIRLKLFFMIGAVLSFFGATALAEGEISAEIDKTTGTTQDQFVYTVTTTARPDEDPRVTRVEGLDIYSRGTSSSVNIVNGRMSREIRYNFVIVAKRTGVFTLPPVTAVFDGKLKQTLPIKLTIEDEASAVAGAESDPPVYLKRNLSRHEVYVGQAIMSRIQLFSRARILQTEADPPKIDGVQRIALDSERNYERVLGGVRYSVQEVTSVLIPTKSGEIEVPAFFMAAKLRVQSRRSSRNNLDSFFNDPFFGGGQAVVRKFNSGPDRIKVLPLPSEGRPANFSGLIGKFSLAVNVPKRSLNVGETVTVTVEIKGEGMLDGLTKLEFPKSASIKVYSDKPEAMQSFDLKQGPQARNVFRFAVVPTVSGTVDLGTVGLAVFNPESKAYETLNGDLGSLNVLGGSGGSLSQQAGAKNQLSVETLADDIIGLHPVSEVSGSAIVSGRDYLISGCAVAASFFWALLAWLFGWRRSKSKDERAVRRSRARKSFESATQKFSGGVSPQNAPDFSAALRIFIGDKLKQDGAAMTTKEAVKMVEAAGLTPELQKKLATALTDLDHLSYGGSGIAANDLGERIKDLAKEVDRQC